MVGTFPFGPYCTLDGLKLKVSNLMSRLQFVPWFSRSGTFDGLDLFGALVV